MKNTLLYNTLYCQLLDFQKLIESKAENRIDDRDFQIQDQNEDCDLFVTDGWNSYEESSCHEYKITIADKITVVCRNYGHGCEVGDYENISNTTYDTVEEFMKEFEV